MKMLIALLLLLPVLASADPQPWMKKDNPNELGLFAFSADTCPISIADMQKQAEDVFIRSRIKPLGGLSIRGNPWMYVNLQCGKNAKGGIVTAYLMIDFVDEMVLENGKKQDVRYEIESHHSFMWHGPEWQLLTAVRDEIEDAMADYLKANFDLGEDNE